MLFNKSSGNVGTDVSRKNRFMEINEIEPYCEIVEQVVVCGLPTVGNIAGPHV